MVGVLNEQMVKATILNAQMVQGMVLNAQMVQAMVLSAQMVQAMVLSAQMMQAMVGTPKGWICPQGGQVSQSGWYGHWCCLRGPLQGSLRLTW